MQVTVWTHVCNECLTSFPAAEACFVREDAGKQGFVIFSARLALQSYSMEAHRVDFPYHLVDVFG